MQGGGGFAEGDKGRVPWNKQTLKKQIATDFQVTKSVWPFSSYGVPDEASLMPGDFSFEEVRLQAYIEAAQGRFAQQVAKEAALAARMHEDRQKLLKNPYHFVGGPGGGPPGGGPGSPGGGGGAGGAWGGGNNNNAAWGAPQGGGGVGGGAGAGGGAFQW